MSTPQKSARSLKSEVSNENPRSKGKGIARNLDSAAAPPPPLSSLNGGELDRGAEDMEASKRVKDEGLLDESIFHQKDREALASRILELENYLHAYQYSMGLLLVEKKEWCSEFEEMKARLAEAEEILKRELAAHIIALSESKKREDNLCKALGVEKQCVSDLEKALREKNFKIERKLHSADAKLAKASRSSEINRKLEDFYDRERKVQREIISIRKKLQDGQSILLDGQRYNNEREERINEAERAFKQKEDELGEAKRSIEGTRSTLKSKEEDLEIRLRVLALKEKKIELKMENLHKKEKDLLEIEKKLNNREREDIQKLLDEHNATLDIKKKEFELELESKRKSIDEELKSKFAAVNRVDKEVNHKQELISMREKELESKMDNIKIKERELEAKSKALKKLEESLKSDEKKLIVEKDQIMKDMDELKVSLNELQSLIVTLEAQECQIAEEREKLEISKEEREQYIQKQSELKQEIENCMNMKEEHSKEIESLREEREKFEKEWKSLDEKKLMLQRETKKIHDEKEKLEKWHHKEQGRLRSEETNAKADIERQLEDIKLQEKAFENTVKHEKLMAQEEITRQLADVTRELELRKHDLEINMQKKQDMERKPQEEEKEFETRKEAELNRITSLINLNDSKIQKLKTEQERLDRVNEEFALQKKKLPEDNNSPAADVVRDSENSPTLAAVTIEQNETEESSSLPENDSSPKQWGRRQSTRRGRGAKLERSRTMKAVVEDTKAILGEISNGEDAKESAQQIDEENLVNTSGTNNTRQKRRHALTSEMTNSEINARGSKSQSQTIYIEGGQCKKRQISTAPVGKERYNLRRSAIAKDLTAATQAVSDQAKAQTTASHQASRDNNQIAKGDVL